MRPKILISTGGGDAGNYLNALRTAGGDGDARYLPAPRPSSYSGLLLAGGEDMDPSLFGQENRGSRSIDRARDQAELALLDAFCQAGRPVLAICRGLQVVNVWLGGALIQDLGPELVPFHLSYIFSFFHPSFIINILLRPFGNLCHGPDGFHRI